MYTIKNIMYKTQLGSSFAITDDILSFFMLQTIPTLTRSVLRKGSV